MQFQRLSTCRSHDFASRITQSPYRLERVVQRPRHAVAPRAQLDLSVAWPLVRDNLTRGAGFAMIAAFAQNALTSLPGKKAEHVADKGEPMAALQQFGFLCEKAVPAGASGAVIGVVAALCMSELGLAPQTAWAAGALTVLGPQGAWWLQSRK